MDAETATNVVGNLLLFTTAIAIGLIPLIVIGLWMKEKAQQNGSRKSQTISDDERRGGPNESSRPSRLTEKISRTPTSDVSIESSWPPWLTGKVSKTLHLMSQLNLLGRRGLQKKFQKTLHLMSQRLQ